MALRQIDEAVMNAARKSKLYDLASVTPVLIWFSLGIVGSLLQIPQPLELRGGAIAICSHLANIVFSSLLILLLVIRRPPVRTAQGLLPRVAGIAGMLLPLLFIALPRAKLTSSWAIFSSAIVFAGTIASIVIACWLGRSFSIFPQARRLVTEGPYRLVRHPLYLTELLTVFGGMWQFEQPWAFIVLLVAIGAQIPRMHFEEQVLMEAFPSYRDYANRTARLLPGLF
jgi:protein-S-isoprenylcysteine O-methyltransferase Ste14